MYRSLTPLENFGAINRDKGGEIVIYLFRGQSLKTRGGLPQNVLEEEIFSRLSHKQRLSHKHHKHYVKERKAFGSPIAEFQNKKFKLAAVATDIRIHRSFIDECITLFSTGELDVPTASMAKYSATEMQGRATDTCLQMFVGWTRILCCQTYSHGWHSNLFQSKISGAWSRRKVGEDGSAR